jgi:EAL domain-containing protein (putative c-di-GMP-specific phosphodiesterase class I)
VSNWVISTACHDIRRLADQTGTVLRVAVNLSSGQFKDPGLIRHVQSSLDGCGLDPRHLEVEITEGTLMESVAATVSTLESLAGAGIQIAVDDFGTGYSSFSYLRRFSVDTIKIDRSFISDTPRNEDARAIVKAIISLGRDLEMNVVAEGIETEDQFRFLQSLGCELAQGYLFSRPVPLDRLRQLLSAWKGIEAACARA